MAIAATVALAAGSLVVGTDKITSQDWRLVIAVALLLVVLAFLIAGVAPLWVSGRNEKWDDANEEDGFITRAGLNLPEAQMARANELLRAYGANDALARWKIDRAHWAAMWFRCALAGLVLLAGVFIIYIGFPGILNACLGQRHVRGRGS